MAEKKIGDLFRSLAYDNDYEQNEVLTHLIVGVREEKEGSYFLECEQEDGTVLPVSRLEFKNLLYAEEQAKELIEAMNEIIKKTGSVPNKPLRGFRENEVMPEDIEQWSEIRKRRMKRRKELLESANQK